jgi:protein-disulfide isomerase
VAPSPIKRSSVGPGALALIALALVVVVGPAARASTVERYRVTVGKAPVRGPADAKVTLVVWADYHCQFCSHLLPVLEQLLAEHPRDLRLAWRQRTLSSRPDALAAAEAALAARDQDRFWPMNALLFAHQDRLAPSDLEGYATELGLDRKRFARALASHRAQREIAADSAAGIKVGAVATPTLYLNGRIVRGYVEHDVLAGLLAEELANADALLAAGTPRSRLLERVLADALPEAPREDNGEGEGDDTVHDVPVADAPVRGAARAAVTIIEFGDYQCPFCAAVEPTLAELRRIYGRRLRIVWKDNPLPAHPQAQLAAEAARVAGDQGRYWQLHDRLLAHHDELSLTTIEEQAAALGLDMDRFRKTLDQGQHRAEIQRDLETVHALGVTGTPTFFINGRKLSGALPVERFRELIDRALGH